MGFNKTDNTIYVGDANGASKLVGAPLPLGIQYGGTGSTTAAAARSALGAAASSHIHTLSQLSNWPGIETTLSGETNKLVTSQAIQEAIPKLVNSDKIEWISAQSANGQYEYWPNTVTADSISSTYGTFNHAADSNYRGVLTLSNPLDSSGNTQGNAIKMYANTSSGGEIDVYGGTGETVLAALFASTANNGVLNLREGTKSYYLTPESIRKANSAISITQIWENGSPGSSFAAQTVPLDLNGYALVLVVFALQTTYPNTTITAVGVVDEAVSTNPYYYNSEYSLYRFFRANDTGLYFDVGYRNSTINNNVLIPRNIYGFKGVA